MTEFVDSFGSFTTDFEATTPVYQSVEDCYKFMFKELAEAIADMTDEAASSDMEKNGDPADAFDPIKWKNCGISMKLQINCPAFWKSMVLLRNPPELKTFMTHHSIPLYAPITVIM